MPTAYPAYITIVKVESGGRFVASEVALNLCGPAHAAVLAGGRRPIRSRAAEWTVTGEPHPTAPDNNNEVDLRSWRSPLSFT